MDKGTCLQTSQSELDPQKNRLLGLFLLSTYPCHKHKTYRHNGRGKGVWGRKIEVKKALCWKLMPVIQLLRGLELADCQASEGNLGYLVSLSYLPKQKQQQQPNNPLACGLHLPGVTVQL